MKENRDYSGKTERVIEEEYDKQMKAIDNKLNIDRKIKQKHKKASVLWPSQNTLADFFTLSYRLFGNHKLLDYLSHSVLVKDNGNGIERICLFKSP